MRDFRVEYTTKNGNRVCNVLKAENQASALIKVLRSTSEDGIHPSVYRVSIRPL